MRLDARWALVAALVVAACTDRVAPPPPETPALDVIPGDPIVLAAGDVVCGTGTSATAPCKHRETAAIVTATAPNAVLLLGDIQYETATLADFRLRYDSTWGAHKAITWPALGNHEYQTSGATGYFDYYNGVGVQTGRAGTRGQGYYSFNLGAWHIIALNSNCASVGGCGVGSLQETWLRADLAANPTACTLAFWHHPRFSSGAHGDNSVMQPLWQALYDHGADLVLAGHDHNYERFGPMNASGAADATRGIRSFVVGVGGKEMRPVGSVKANSQLRNSNSIGLLKLSLHASSYDWQFLPIPGHTLNDAGTAQCVTGTTPPPPPPPPPTGTTLTIYPSADAYTFRNSQYTNYGNATTLLVDGSPQARTYFKFDVTGLTGKTVVSAKLRIHAVDPSDAGGRLHRLTSNSWTETNIRWSNQPSYNSAVVGSIGSVVANTWYEIEVKSVITANGTYSFVLESTSTNGADYVSRQGASANRPRLVVIVQ